MQLTFPTIRHVKETPMHSLHCISRPKINSLDCLQVWIEFYLDIPDHGRMQESSEFLDTVIDNRHFSRSRFKDGFVCVDGWAGIYLERISRCHGKEPHEMFDDRLVDSSILNRSQQLLYCICVFNELKKIKRGLKKEFKAPFQHHRKKPHGMASLSHH